jgi:glycosyltransferase involved in cell wall biosynthesis
VAVVFQHIGPYHHARLNAAARFLRVVGVEWSGHDSFGWGQSGEASAYRKVSLFDHAQRGSHANSVLASRMAAALKEIRPDVVAVNGWGDFASVLTLRCCHLQNVPIVLMSESSTGDERRTWIKESIKTRIVGLCSAALVGGQSHVAYLAALGLSPDRISTGYDVVDNAHFARGADAARADPEPQRQSAGLPRNYFLASSRFIPKKNLLFLVRAYARYHASHRGAGAGGEAWKLVILGDGPLRPAIDALARDLNVADAVVMPGFRKYEELPGYYGLASAFVHASTTEQWGLVVNEAMASGLPVIVSKQCGCAGDLVRHGENGFQFDPRDEAGLAAYMTQIARDPACLARMGQRSRELIGDWGPNRFGLGLRDAAQCALRVGARPRSWFAGPLLGVLSRVT